MKLRTKFVLLIGLVIAVVMLITSVLLLIFEKQHLIEETKKDQIALVKGLGRVSREALLTKDYFFLINYVKAIKENTNTVAYALFIDRENRILAHTDPQFLRQIVEDSISIKSQASQTLFIQSYRMTSDPDNPEIIDISLPVFLGEERKGTARIGFSKAMLNELIDTTLNKTRQRILITVLVVSLFGLMCVFILAHTITRPVKILAEGADLIGQGKLDTKIRLKGKDELAWLATKFNEMGEKLEELDQMKRDFVSSVTHELRSPLGAIETYINKMLDGGFEGFTKTGLEDLTIMKNNAIRLSRFINDLLDVAKMEATRMEIEPTSLKISSVVQDVVTLFKLKAEEKNINLEAKIPSELPEAFADSERIRQVLINLVSNSLKFTPGGGSVNITAETMKETPGYIQIRVSDTGMGIPPEDLDKIFDKFQQIKEAREKVEGAKGTGLGLFIVKNIVELHGGKVWVRSELGKGTTFIFTLPTRNVKIKNK
jgi:signal transduction histidine kinase